MQIKTGYIVLLTAAVLVGCSREDAESSSAAGKGLPEDNVFSDQVQTLDKARDVQNTLDDATAKQREAIQQQEQR